MLAAAALPTYGAGTQHTVVFDLVIARYLRTALEVDIAAGAEKRLKQPRCLLFPVLAIELCPALGNCGEMVIKKMSSSKPSSASTRRNAAT